MATTDPPKKQMQLNFYEVACTGIPNAIGQWKSVPPFSPPLLLLPSFLTQPPRTPNDNSRTKDRLSYWTWLARTAEKGKISCIFFADAYGELEVYQGKADAQYKGGNHVAKFEPTVLVSAMATVTK
jgi:hypothetical protein